MYTMFDLFRQAQGGAAFDNIARAYGMSPEQMRAATAALTPAFMQGFQRQATSDGGAQRFAELFQTETYARAFEAQAAALDPASRTAGENALGALFGDKEVSRAVAAQAANASGVQAQIIRQVLPILASILMGGFMKSLQGAGAPQGGGGASPFPGPLGDVLGQIFGGGRASPTADRGQSDAAGQSPQGPGNPFQDWMESFSGGRAGGGQLANPMGEMMGDILNSMFGGAKPAAPDIPQAGPAPEAAAKGSAGAGGPKPRQAEPAKTPFDDMIASGRELSNQNAQAMEAIFDAFFGGGRGRR